MHKSSQQAGPHPSTDMHLAEQQNGHSFHFHDSEFSVWDSNYREQQLSSHGKVTRQAKNSSGTRDTPGDNNDSKTRPKKTLLFLLRACFQTFIGLHPSAPHYLFYNTKST